MQVYYSLNLCISYCFTYACHLFQLLNTYDLNSSIRILPWMYKLDYLYIIVIHVELLNDYAYLPCMTMLWLVLKRYDCYHIIHNYWNSNIERVVRPVNSPGPYMLTHVVWRIRARAVDLDFVSRMTKWQSVGQKCRQIWMFNYSYDYILNSMILHYLVIMHAW